MTYREAITAALDDALAADPAVLLMGEDVGADGGVFKTNNGLIEKYGAGPRPLRRRSARTGSSGVALGMSLVGMRPIVEIMFADFLPTAGDAIVNQLPKYRFMSGGQCNVPVTIRVIGGGTGRFGTQHSATFESWFMHLPGLRVVTAVVAGLGLQPAACGDRGRQPGHLLRAQGALRAQGPGRRAARSRRSARPTVVREGERRDDRGHDADGRTGAQGRRGAGRRRHRGRGHRPPLDPPDRPADGPGHRSRRPAGWSSPRSRSTPAGWGATVISELAQAGVAFAAPPRRVSLPDDYPIPYTPPLEDLIVPSADAIAEAARAATGR